MADARPFTTTRGKILVSLCRGRHTVAELAHELSVTDNAIRAQLQRLQRGGLILRSCTRRDGCGSGAMRLVRRRRRRRSPRRRSRKVRPRRFPALLLRSIAGAAIMTPATMLHDDPMTARR